MSFQPLCLGKAALLVNGVSLLISNLSRFEREFFKEHDDI